MFLREGYLTYYALVTYLSRHYGDMFTVRGAETSVPEEDAATDEELERAMLWYNARCVFDRATYLHLIPPVGEIVTVDRALLLQPMPDNFLRATDVPLRTPMTKRNVEDFFHKMVDPWIFVSCLTATLRPLSEIDPNEMPIRDLPLLEPYERLLKPYMGYAVCIKTADADAEMATLLGAINQPKTDGTGKVDYSARLGEILSKFPHGKGGATWAEVISAIGYSRRDINRVLEACGRKDWLSRAKD